MSTIRSIRSRRAGPSQATAAAVAGFLDAQHRVLQRYRVDAERRFVVPTVGGCAQVLVAGDGPALPMVIGGTLPGAFWAPLMAKLPGRTLYAIELPGFGLTDPVRYHHRTVRRTAVAFLAGVLDALELDEAAFATHSTGSLWTAWLAADRPGRVRSQVMVGCPAFFPGTFAPRPMRLASVPGLGPVLISLSKPFATGAQQMIRMVGEDPTGLTELRDLLVAAQRVPTYDAAMVALTRACTRWTRPRPEIAVTPDQLRRITHPVRLIWGEDDRFGAPRAGGRVAALIPDADLHRVPGGHAPWFHHADVVAGLVREFLEEHP